MRSQFASAVAAAALNLAAQPVHAETKSPASIECKAAEDLVMQMAGSSDRLIGTGLPTMDRKLFRFDFVRAGWTRQPPPESLLKKFYASPDRSALSCPNMLTRLRAQGVGIYEHPEGAPFRLAPGSMSPKTHAFGIPSVSADGRQAIILVAGTAPVSWDLKYFVQTQGIWKEVSAKNLAIS